MSNATIKTPAKKTPASKVSVMVNNFHASLEVFKTALIAALEADSKIEATIEIMRKTRVKLGTIKQKCPNALAVQSMLQTMRYKNHITGKVVSLSPATVANYLCGIRQCLADHKKVFSKNMARDAANKAKAEAKGEASSKGTAPDDIPSIEKTGAVKIAEQLNNALKIAQGDESPKYDVVTVTKLLQQALILVNQ